MSLKLKIVSPERIEYSGEVTSVLSFEILNDHAPIISSLQPGVVEYATADGKVQLTIKGGFVEVQKNEVSLCVEIN